MDNNKKTLILLSAVTFLANGDNLAASTLLSDIARDLGLTVSTAALSVTSYMLAFGLFTIFFGPLSDRYGKARVINVAAIGTAVFSMVGALAYDLTSLAFFRAMNGLFGAGIMPVAVALIGEIYGENQRQKAIGTVLGVAFLGGAMSTAIGGAISYFGSWRLVYLAYGVAELILALLMLKVIQKDTPKSDTFNLFASYKVALSNSPFMRKISLIALQGIVVFGSFTYAGVTVAQKTGFNVLFVGITLSLFGIGTVLGGQLGAALKKRMNNSYLVLAGFIGLASLNVIAFFDHAVLLGIGLLGFGVSHMMVQTALLATVQDELHEMKGTVMSLASFALFVGSAVGTSVIGAFIATAGATVIYSTTSSILMVNSILAAILITGYEIRKQKLAFSRVTK